MKNKFYKILAFSFLSFGTILAQSAGNSGLSFLKFGFGARNIAMGDAGSALSRDVTSLFYNPANLSLNDNSEIMLMHNQSIQDVQSEVLGAKTLIWGLPIAVGFNVTNVNDIEVRTRPGDPVASFNAHYFFGSLSTGFHVSNDVAIGFSLKYLYEGLYTDEATGLGFDFGVNYQTPIDGLSASVVAKNLGSMNKLKNEKTKLPTEIRIGAAYLLDSIGKFDVTGVGEFQKYTATSDNHFNVGAEVAYNKLLALRFGYQTNYISKGFTAGFGLMWGSIHLDYAFQPYSFGLGSANMFSLKIQF